MYVFSQATVSERTQASHQNTGRRDKTKQRSKTETDGSQEMDSRGEAQDSAGDGGMPAHGPGAGDHGPCWSSQTGQGRQEAVSAPDTGRDGIQHRQGPGSDSKISEAASQPNARGVGALHRL